MNPHGQLSSNRRQFLVQTLVSAAGAGLLPSSGPAQSRPAAGTKLRAAIIGHTGRGDYGHGLDTLFNLRPDVEVVALADPDEGGRKGAAKKSRALRQYSDYREMLEKERPQLVSIAPRWTDQHHAMGMAALQTGAHLFFEKPLSQTLAEADELLAVADQRGLKIAVAHQMRLAPSIVHLKKSLDQGLLGELAQIHAFGKQDTRAGGEDMLVLGTHLFDLIRYFAGDPIWCAARVLFHGREITPQDAHPSNENIGRVAGDEIDAQFAFSNGLIASFTSRGKLRQTIGHWGMELIGSKGVVRVLANVHPTVYLLKSENWEPSGKNERWQRLPNDPSLNASPDDLGFALANERVVNDWLQAIKENREPVCSGRAAMRALEMVMAVYRAALAKGRVTLPLTKREHPLGAL